MANPSYDPTDSHSEFLVKLVLLRLHNALEHVAKSMVLVPVAVGLTGLFLFYQCVVFVVDCSSHLLTETLSGFSASLLMHALPVGNLG